MGDDAAEQHAVPVEWQTDGFAGSFGRFEEAAKGTNPAIAFHALFEALSWAASVDERLEFPQSPHLRGLRFARHRVHHQWADALWLDRSGLTFPISFPMVFFEWRWRDADDLPEGRTSRDEAAYREHLAGAPARLTLGHVFGLFNSLNTPGSVQR